MLSKKMLLIYILILIFVSAVSAISPKEKVKIFTLKDYNGKEHSLSQYSESKAIVIMFIATKCPVSNAYNERMAKLYTRYNDKGITFIGINSNKAEDAEEVSEHASENNLSFTILKDPNNIIADQFDAKFTPEIFVLNGNLNLLYHGRIDDSRDSDKVDSKDLAITLEAILAGKDVPVSETKAFGCSIKRVDK